MPFGLTNEHWDGIQRVLTSNPKVEALILYGSRAKGTYKSGSDVDLALVGDLTSNDLLDFHNGLDDLDLPYRFDLVNYRQLAASEVRAHIDRVGVRVFESAAQA